MPKTERKEVQMPVLQVRADVQSVDEDKRTAEVIWSTGARVLRMRFFDDPFYEELSMESKAIRMDRLTSGRMPLLNSHRSWDLSSVIGVVESASVTNGEGRATVRFSEREDVEPIWQDVRNGIIANISVGYRVYRYRDVTEQDDEFQVLRAIDWEPMEISAVPIGADEAAGFRSDGNTNACRIEGAERVESPETEETSMPRDNEQHRGAPAETEVDANRTPETPAEPERTAAPNPQDVSRAERERVQGIHKAVQRAGLSSEKVKANDGERSFADDLIERNLSLDQARAEIGDKLVERQEQRSPEIERHVDVVHDETDKFRAEATSAILMRANVEKVDMANGMRGFGLLDYARMCLDHAGVRTSNMSKDQIARAVLTHTTSDFPNIFENAMHKTLLAAYEGVELTWGQFCAVGDLSDFRPHLRYRMGSFGRLQGLNENGELKHTTMPDAEKESIAADENGLIVTLSYKMLVNDDMGAFISVAQGLGRTAALSVEEDVFTLLTSNPTMSDGTEMFHADHNNLAGSGAAVSVATLGAARAAMRKQKDPGGNSYIMLTPSILLLPVAAEEEAWAVINSPTDPSKTNSRVANREHNRWTLLSSPYLDEASAAAWYAFASPAQAPALEVGFVNGQRTPVVETEGAFDSRGIKYRVTHDYGVAERDYRPAYKNPGE